MDNKFYNLLFKDLKSYDKYLKKYPIHKLFGLNLKTYGNVKKKINRSIYYSVNPNLKESYSVELDDLIRLHYLIISRKVTTILEFGVGKSSVVFDNALKLNKSKYLNFVLNNLRRSNAFQCFSIDNNLNWLLACKKKYRTKLINYHYSKCVHSTFNGRICTLYNSLPNISPDFIYLDAPDQFSPTGSIRGVSTRNADRLPMAADILSIEHFLLPGTLIVVDGRTANARFLKTNLQRNWTYYHSKKNDQHYFELTEMPLGVYNKKQIDHCLGQAFYLRVKNKSK